MTLIGRLALFCVLMGLVKMTTEVLLVALALAWIYGAIVRPAETFTLLFLLTLAACIRAYPGWSLLALAALSITALFARSDSA
jgi:hypothetical protein